jgi:hypothetical protein
MNQTPPTGDVADAIRAIDLFTVSIAVDAL